MQFLAPAALAGLAAVSLPVIIHLLNKLRIREVRWAAMRFLLAAAQKNQRRVKMQDLLLLILRCLVLALIVFAFARPTFQAVEKSSLVAGDPLTVMVLLDQSASMGASDGVETRFAAARTATLSFLEELPSGSAAGLLLVNDSYASPVSRPSRDLSLVRRSVELAKITDRGTDFQPALRAAIEALRNLPGRREIHLFTDNQLSGWRTLEPVREFLKTAPDIKVFIVTPGAGSASTGNLAITNLKLDTAIPVAGQPMRVLAEITNHGEAPVDGVRLTLSVDDDAPSADAVVGQLAAGGTRYVPLLVRLPGTGFHTLTAALPSDRLAFDNRRTLALEIAPARDVLVVESRRGPAPWQGTGHFLASALAPVDEEAASRHYLHVTRVTAADVDASKLSGYSVIFLAGADPLLPAAVTGLAQFVRDGGGLVVMPGDATPADLFLDAPWPDLLPASINPPSAPSQGTIEAGPYNNPLLTLWNDPASGNLSAVRFSKVFSLDPVKSAEVSTVLRLADTTPVIMERTVGKGRVVLFAAPPVPTWTNLPLHPAFVPLVHRLYAATAHTSSLKLNLAPGDTFQAPVPIEQLNRDVYVRGPGENAKIVAVGRTELVGTQAMLRVRNTSDAGRYTVYVGQNERPDFYFAVQSPSDESDLKTAPSDILTTDVIPTATAAGASAPAAVAAPSGPLLTARQLWMIALAAAAFLSCTELMLALRSSRSR
ncbi:BatA domain-containing protein [Rariglobus hedericola]|uniref:VWA domain-containing protein n=1 Tax=Rariglobus hedericola TaxID=2597822 RepID=A0A556QS44_9BACT|nr:BatA domain-containing protein [Rariglobus hedericola]TSJ79464.1 VWA domain-containing protein [Rariglobus hedericola]